MCNFCCPEEFRELFELAVLTGQRYQYRVAKTYGMFFFMGHFLQKSLIVDGSSAERDLQLKLHPIGLRYVVDLFCISLLTYIGLF